MPGHVEMNHPAPTMGQNYQNEQNPKSRGGHGKEIDRDQIVHVIVEERLPSLRRRSTLSGQESRHGSFRDVDTHLQQLAVDAGAPQSGLAAAIFRIRALTAGLASGRPLFRLEIQLQNRRKPLRCQATTVSGLTMINTRCQSFQLLDSHTQKRRSVLRSRGRGHFRLNTASC